MEHNSACGPFRDRLIEFAAGHLSPTEQAEIERHLTTCAACREQLRQEWRAIGGELAAAVRRVPTDAHAARGWARMSAALLTQPVVLRSNAVATFFGDQALDTPGELERTRMEPTDDFATEDVRETRPVTRLPLPRLARRISGIGAVTAALLIVVLGVAIVGAFGPGRPGVGAKPPTPNQTATSMPEATPSPTSSPTPSPTLPPMQASTCPADRTSYAGETGMTIESLSMLSAAEGWGAVLYGAPLHFSNCRWSPLAGVDSLTSISMLSPTDGWAVSYDTSRPIYHLIGGTWVRQPAVGAGDGSSYVGIRMQSATDGWIIGSRPKSAQSQYSYYALHYNGASWSQIELPLNGFFDLAAVGPNEMWISGADRHGNAVLLHDVAGTFTTYVESNGSFRRFQVNSPNDIWVVGWYGLAYDYQESSGVYVLHWDGMGWQPVPMSKDSNIQQGKGFAIFSPADAWAFPAPVSLTIYTPVTSARRLTPSGWQTFAWPFTDIVSVPQVVKVGVDEYWAIGDAQETVKTDTGTGVVQYGVLLHFADGQWSEYGHKAP